MPVVHSANGAGHGLLRADENNERYTAGFVVGIPLFICLGQLFGDTPGPVVGDAAAGVIYGAEFGIAQWLILRRQGHKIGWWVAASIVGFTIGFPLTKTRFGELSSGLVVAGVDGTVVGAIVGALQWLVLRGRVTRAGWWVLASTRPGRSAQCLAKSGPWPPARTL